MNLIRHLNENALSIKDLNP